MKRKREPLVIRVTLTSSSSLSDARGTTDAKPAFRFVAMAIVIVLTTSSLTRGIDFLREASRMSGVASMPEKNGLSLYFEGERRKKER